MTLRPLALGWLALLAACASPRPPPVATLPPSLTDVDFVPMEGDPGRLRWSARAGFHEVAAFVEGLTGRFPAGCSARLSMRFAEVREGRTLVDAAGTVVRERGERDAGTCIAWPGLARALDGVSATIPQRAWATEMIQDGDRFELQGRFAGADEEVNAFSGRLGDVEPFRESRVVSIRPLEDGGPTTTEFRLELRLSEEG